MTSALTRRGSTRRWREIRAAILRRDRYLCQMWRGDVRCGAPATDVNHKIRRRDAPPGFPIDAASNLEAACTACNRGEAIAWDQITTARPTAAAVAITALLDRAGLPHTVGIRQARPVLAAAGHRWRSRDIAAAVAWRRYRGPLIRV